MKGNRSVQGQIFFEVDLLRIRKTRIYMHKLAWCFRCVRDRTKPQIVCFLSRATRLDSAGTAGVPILRAWRSSKRFHPGSTHFVFWSFCHHE